MTSSDVRRSFLDFFASRGHRIVPSSPLVLPRDPTLLFANAGMNQFKDVFTGSDRRDYSRAVTVQKCLRVSGKHNDLEQVGRTPRHHTFFEMLGNFSFGDYFKEEAIRLAWELMTQAYGLPAERLWVTVFAGTESLPADDEALALWRDRVGVPAERILRLGEKDNFWRMGDSGPCGPCSELHYDLGEDLTSVSGPSTPATDEQRFMEVWNLVFMQFEQRTDGALVPLPAPSIDTGMGLERIASILQGQRSNFDSDLFRPLLDAAGRAAGVAYGAAEASDFSLRVIADHARALCALVAEGVVPANDKRGYVLRRLLRRAIRHGRKLGLDRPFLHEVTPVAIEILGTAYPEFAAARTAILEVGRREEQRFADTLSAGLGMLETALAALPTAGDRRLGGAELFRLYDTFGFPLDLARDVAAERGVALDEAGFEEEMGRQRTRAQASWKGGAREESSGSWNELSGEGPTPFHGYAETRLDGVVVRAAQREGQPVGALAEGEEGEVLLDRTPFYAESGGQVADRGWLLSGDGRAEVLDVQRPVNGLIVHRVRVVSGRLALDAVLRAEVDEAHREAVRRNHTGTHLLHAALREVLGTHVKQAGSLVAPERLRFDFAHFATISDEALADIESVINRKVLQDLAVETESMPIDEALNAGAMALFGEKYGAMVRCVRIGDFSLELCGGTHCERSGQIGLIKVTAERGIASGVRRIEAVTGEHSLLRFREQQAIVRSLEAQLSVSGDRLLPEIERRLEQVRVLERELEQVRVRAVRQRLAEQAAHPEMVAGTKLLRARADGLSSQDLRGLADGLRQQLGSGVVVLGRAEPERASLIVAVTEDLKARLPAGELVRELTSHIGGSGGGRADLAEAGGKNPAGLDAALAAVSESIQRRLEGDR